MTTASTPDPGPDPGSSGPRPGHRPILPPALRLPAAAGLVVFVVAVGTTQLALQVTNRQADRQLQEIGQVYLDGLVASVRPGLQMRDPDYIASRFTRAFSEQYGVAERGLFAYGADGRLLARHGDPNLPEPPAETLTGSLWRIDAKAGVAWVSRRVEQSTGPLGSLVAALDVAPILAARQRLALTVVAVDLLLAGAFALLTGLVLRRLGRPLRMLVQELSEGAHRPPARLPEALVAGADPRTAHVLRAYNRMADGVQERERLAAVLAEREQMAALGQLAATVAHEVRNPLGGLATAVSTLRRFGDRAEVREESLGFLERGIAALERIVNSTLDAYRPADDRPLTRADFDDLRHLVRPAAERRGVAVVFELDLPQGAIGLGAGGVRQVLLNLLLNACAATPPQGVVGLQARIVDGELLCEIIDEGPGLDPAKAGRLSAGVASEPGARGLGLSVVVSLLGNLDARASVTERPAGGTAIRLAIPLVAPHAGEVGA
ncbi:MULTISPECIES: sensor histidine kinase [Roseomonadaceae]|uniref:histidine kinase n=1 Tax=Falsiroseomonas oleicola TaxID=2801474 RepID=A0ABS6H0D1_9PROT|nr:HAMP domain-containing sensor histidine kinase [Roseomonas oleicola]MBU8542122.1 HAMP domain-containing histidine kinase [Roseomonas oleicola]